MGYPNANLLGTRCITAPYLVLTFYMHIYKQGKKPENKAQLQGDQRWMEPAE